jgi:LysR family transcriptional regulator, glycine cleavage system transcriptional activator
MTTSHLPLKALAGFRAAARHGSFQSAARDLGLTPSAISHQVAQIEGYLGAPVFVRATRSVSLTPLGRKTMKAADRLFDELERLRAGARPGHALKVTALPLFTQVWLMPRIARFNALYPDISVTISTENKVADLSAGEADVGIRNLRTKPAGVVARKLMDIRGIPVCSPALKMGRKALRTPEDLARHTLIQISARPGAWESWFAAQGLTGATPRSTLTVDMVPAALEAAAQGAGIALGMDPLIWDAEVSKGLVRAIDTAPVSDSAYYVCVAKARARDPRIAAFTDWLFQEAARRGKKIAAVPA